MQSFRMLLPVVAWSLLSLTGCAPQPDRALSGADVAFLQGMIRHHEEAIAMAELVPERTERQELVALSRSIGASQRAEIIRMQDMLAADLADPSRPADVDARPRMHDATGTGDHMAPMDPDSMPMQEMEALALSSGPAFDVRFAESMIRHHREAIDHAEWVLAEGQDPTVAELARGIIAEQEAEVARLVRWLEEWRTG